MIKIRGLSNLILRQNVGISITTKRELRTLSQNVGTFMMKIREFCIFILCQNIGTFYDHD